VRSNVQAYNNKETAQALDGVPGGAKPGGKVLMSKTAKKLMMCALSLYAGSFLSCYIAARPRQPAPGEVWASGFDTIGWYDFGFALLIVAGGFTLAAIRFSYHRTG
jgi:hypothetical protein